MATIVADSSSVAKIARGFRVLIVPLNSISQDLTPIKALVAWHLQLSL